MPPEASTTALVSGRFLDGVQNSGNRNLSFVRSYAGFTDLGRRIGNVMLTDANGNPVNFQTAVPGEYVADAAFIDWSYSIDLAPRKEQNAAAHLSWLSNERGVLMFGDLLPIFTADSAKMSGRVELNFKNVSAKIKDFTISSDDVRNEVISVGSEVRARTEKFGTLPVRFEISGEWLFTDDELTKFAKEIYDSYRSVFSGDVSKGIAIRLLRFPSDISHGVWQADTRGGNITIVSSDMPFKTQSVQRLHEQLRHEMFHLWIPNGVNLSGNYDWFYEGFALYTSLKVAVAHNRIRFEDMLDTLSRAYAIDSRQTNRISLVAASNTRFNGNETQIYARGMATAFLCDILLMDRSRGKHSISDLLLAIYSKYKYPNQRTDGNTAVISTLQKYPVLVPVIEKYINGTGVFEWQSELLLAGLESTKNGLVVTAKLTGRQKDLLEALGYNNWRRPPLTK
ncbi:MAG: hypothetical protein ACJ72Z_00425 [Pyrinomonadaceae bacterium]